MTSNSLVRYTFLILVVMSLQFFLIGCFKHPNQPKVIDISVTTPSGQPYSFGMLHEISTQSFENNGRLIDVEKLELSFRSMKFISFNHRKARVVLDDNNNIFIGINKKFLPIKIVLRDHNFIFNEEIVITHEDVKELTQYFFVQLLLRDTRTNNFNFRYIYEPTIGDMQKSTGGIGAGEKAYYSFWEKSMDDGLLYGNLCKRMRPTYSWSTQKTNHNELTTFK